jgi:hypothetical protein
MLLKASTQNPNKNSKERRKIMNARKKFLMALAIVGCAVLLVAGSIAGTLAYLTSMTGPVTNTFTAGNITITLDESKVDVYGKLVSPAERVTKNEYKFIPGLEYVKDPIVTVKKGSEACYLFVKIDELNNTFDTDKKYFTYGVATEWLPLTGVDGVYYQEVTAPTASDAVLPVLKDNEIVANSAVTAENLQALGANKPSLNLTAYAVQQTGFGDAKEAWDAARFDQVANGN